MPLRGGISAAVRAEALALVLESGLPDPRPDAAHSRRGKANRVSNDLTGEAAPGDFESVLKPLWRRAQAGDEAAYRDALNRIAARLRQFLRRRMQSMPDDVEDLVQETLLALHLQRASCDLALPVSSWVFAIARHKLIDLWRRRGRQEALHDPIDDLDEAQMPAAHDEGCARCDLGALLQELPPAQREAIVLTKVEGLSVAEAAQRTGASASAIKVQVHRGLKRLAALVRQGAARPQ
ncbi:MAG: sigma-70 family RNA polymerase sigma factor [Burkholderiales bacterium]|nr:sigma-70 family RNA polymerase sigma factor [Burkholderiales bacterium]